MLERLRAISKERVPAALTKTPTADVVTEDRTTVEPERSPESASFAGDDRSTNRHMDGAPPEDLNRSTVKDMRRFGLLDRALPGRATSRIERIRRELTPAPLPAAPGAEDAEQVLFESVPTSPAGPPDLAALGLLGDDPGYTPSEQRRRSAAADSVTVRGHRQRIQGAPLDEPWMLPALLAVTSLAVGMVIGALLFGGNSSHAVAPAEQRDAGVCVCPEPPDAPAAPPRAK